MVATTADLAALVRGYMTEGQIPADSPLAHGWRHSLCGRLLVDLLEGRVCLRIVKSDNEMPLAIQPT
jgi:hypothetical protein